MYVDKVHVQQTRTKTLHIRMRDIYKTLDVLIFYFS